MLIWNIFIPVNIEPFYVSLNKPHWPCCLLCATNISKNTGLCNVSVNVILHSVVVKIKDFSLLYEWRSLPNCKLRFYASRSAWSKQLTSHQNVHTTISRLSLIPLHDMRFCYPELWNSTLIWFYNSFTEILHLWCLNIGVSPRCPVRYLLNVLHHQRDNAEGK